MSVYLHIAIEIFQNFSFHGDMVTAVTRNHLVTVCNRFALFPDVVDNRFTEQVDNLPDFVDSVPD